MDTNIQERLDQLFGSYKAEWLKKDIFKLFTAPYYFNRFKGNSPGVLQGGRGTGKTTVLRGLSYIGQYELLNSNIDRFDGNSYIGIYYRANTNHVRAFSGKGLKDDNWKPIFGHYVNLIICWEILHFIKWHKELRKDDEDLQKNACNIIASSLHLLGEIDDFNTLLQAIEKAVYTFQADVNNVADGNIPKLSMAGMPIDIVAQETEKLRQFQGKTFYLLIDEYENFTDYQQECLNTLIKHVPESYTIKIGVREMGWRVKTTLNSMESLNEPADYQLTNIEELFTNPKTANLFDEFAANVCNLRLRELMDDENNEYDIKTALASMSIEEESEKLNVTRSSYYKDFVEVENSLKKSIDIHPLYKFFIAYWAEIHNESINNMISDFLLKRNVWNHRYENYRYSLLFKLNRGKFVGIQKYYAGWKTFIKLANGNIRYLMELVYQAYSFHIARGRNIKEPLTVEDQTTAAQNVGWKNLTELEGSCKIGTQLTKLVQSLGSIFNKLARDGDRTAPEVNQFDIYDEISDRTHEILDLGVMNLALVRMPSNKLSGQGDIKDFQYQLHPIFAPFFIYSFRKKRKLPLSEADFLGCIDNPRDTVKKILGSRDVTMDEDKPLPAQLSLFDISDFAK